MTVGLIAERAEVEWDAELLMVPVRSAFAFADEHVGGGGGYSYSGDRL